MTDARCSHLDFLIIGAMKAGTSSMFDFLAAQPGVHAPRNKEPHYFSRSYRMPVTYYRWVFRGRSEGQITGEASPTYSWVQRYPDVPRRIAADAPGIPLIFMIRDPVERLLSHYRHRLLLGQQSGEAAGVIAPALWERSSYRTTVEAYLEHVDARQLLVVDLDDVQNGGQPLLQVLDHLGLPRPRERAELPASNVSSERSSMPRPIGLLARTPAGAFLRDMVPRAGIQSAKKLLGRTTPAPPAFRLDSNELRLHHPEQCADIDEQYAWVRQRFINLPDAGQPPSDEASPESST